ncbi:MAG: selenium cofactor biosynthesis protein YqeC [Candidatus Binatia bacterium]
MHLKEALGLANGEMVSLIGAGGKTTTLLHLAKELRADGKKVLITTTSQIVQPTRPHVDKLFLVEDIYALLAETAKLDPPLIVGAGSSIDDGKLFGLPARWLDEIDKNKQFDAILVEADGAAARLFKVPSEIEPVVPFASRLTVWILAIKILGKPLDAAWVHRPERVAALSGATPGVPVTEELILQLARHSEGCLKGIPPESRKVAMINQADSAEEIDKAKHLGNALLGLGFERVVINSFINNGPLNEIISS